MCRQQQQHQPSATLSLLGLIAGLMAATVSATGKEKVVTISTAEDLIAFSAAVNAGTSYLGTTVELSGDIDLEGARLTPIGAGEPGNDGTVQWTPFEGVFDGKEHLIKNATIAGSIKRYVGLFGYTRSATIRNLAFSTGTSFDVWSTTTAGDRFIGGIAGYCEGTCTIESCFSQAVISIGGNHSGITVGGMIGACNGACTIRNSVQGASATFGGRIEGSKASLRIGGIAGSITGNCHVTNNVIYGIIVNACTAAAQDAFVGGIIGYAGAGVTVENCVTLGFVLSFFEGTHTGTLAGASVGQSDASPNVFSGCYWDESHKILYNLETPINASEHTTTAGLSSYNNADMCGRLLTELNTFAHTGGNEKYAKWACILFDMRRNDARSSVPPFIIPIGFWTPLFSLDRPQSKTAAFDWWCTDTSLAQRYSPEHLTEGVNNLYGKWADEHFVTFTDADGSRIARMVLREGTTFTAPAEHSLKDFEHWTADSTVERKGAEYVTPDHDVAFMLTVSNEVPIVFFSSNDAIFTTIPQQIGSKIVFPKTQPTKAGHSFGGWKVRGASNDDNNGGNSNSEPTKVPEYKVEYDAVWIVNAYTITFVTVSNTVYASSKQKYGTEIVFPQTNPARNGLMFTGWAGNIEPGTTTVPDHDLVFHATWKMTSDTVMAVAVSIIAIAVAGVIMRIFTKSSTKDNKEKKNKKKGSSGKKDV